MPSLFPGQHAHRARRLSTGGTLECATRRISRQAPSGGPRPPGTSPVIIIQCAVREQKMSAWFLEKNRGSIMRTYVRTSSMS